ncbi:MAG: VTT domain-containing protein [Candidatus Aminicenantia bacterium]
MKFLLSKKWLIFEFIFLTCCVIAGLTWKYFPSYQGLVKYFFYTIISHLYISIFPHEPVLLYYGKIYHPLFVAVSGGIAATLAGFIDYETINSVVKLKSIKKLYYETKLYQKAVKFFSRAPFLMIVTAALTPVPFYPFKFLSTASDYPENKYLLALFIGRTPRYFILAYTGKVINIPNWILIAAFVLMFLWAVIKKLPEIIKNKKNPKSRVN